MFEKIFKYHYSKKYAYVLDGICLFLAIEVLLYLNGSNIVIRSLTDKIIFIVLALACLTLLRGYRMLLRFTTFIDIGKITMGLVLTLMVYALYVKANTRAHYNYLLLLFYFSLSFLSLYRLIVKLLYARVSKEQKLTATILFGAGVNGLMAKRALDDSNSVNVLAFVDDDKTKVGRSIEGISVFALDEKLKKTVEQQNIDQVIITTDKISQKRKNEVFNFFKLQGVKIFTVPAIDKWANSQGIVGNLKPIIIEDLLRRDAIDIDLQKNVLQYQDKTILVTGAAGSIGSEIVRQLLKFKPHKLILFDQAETPLFDLKNELFKAKHTTQFEFLLRSVSNYASVEQCFKAHAIDVVFHAAAYKHVFMTETTPAAAVLNNILGTKIVVDLAIKNAVGHFVMVSTDKAVNPSNVMGASKRIAEMYVANQAESSNTQLITTRFGNVLGSNGSVVPIFKEQIAKGGPVTVTHPEITRFFMTITEACQLVLEAGATGTGGEIYVFDMGAPVKIKDLAISMIRLSGLVENQDITIEYSGLRPGEKLYEELLTDNENLKPSHNELIYIAQKESFGEEKIQQIERLIAEADLGKSNEILVQLMKKIVPEFKSMNSSYEKMDS
ncbi:polysaccharide biosynthesis protein [Flavobacteriaceae bacterium]|nr:polysaccharide biosynthesis protein [Flavobacteriaceae bacterium]MDC1439228.1 polysaccharide biosynthesis protein [Flavobacteriaceae bacterium]